MRLRTQISTIVLGLLIGAPALHAQSISPTLMRAIGAFGASSVSSVAPATTTAASPSSAPKTAPAASSIAGTTTAPTTAPTTAQTPPTTPPAGNPTGAPQLQTASSAPASRSASASSAIPADIVPPPERSSSAANSSVSSAKSSTAGRSSSLASSVVTTSSKSSELSSQRSSTAAALSSSAMAASSEGEIAGAVTPESSSSAANPTFARETFGYTDPIIPEDAIPLPAEAFALLPDAWINLLLSILLTGITGLTSMLLGSTIAKAPLRVRHFLRRLPLSLAVFLLIVGALEFLIPSAVAQGTAAAARSPGLFVILYGLLFFVVAGITNFVCNNMLAAEAERIERFLLPPRAVRLLNTSKSWKHSIPIVAVFLLVYAIIGAHISTSFSLMPVSQPGVVLIAFVGILIAAYAKDGLRFLLAKRVRWGAWLEANIVGILLSILSIWITRSLSLSPGYLFGVPAAVIITSATFEKHEGPFEWAGLLSMLVCALVFWLLVPFAANEPVLRDFLRLLIVILLEACFIESLPLPYVAGISLYRWKKWAWMLQGTLATFLVLQLLWNPGSTVGSLVASPPSLTYLLLLGLYVLSVVGLYAYCKFAKQRHD